MYTTKQAARLSGAVKYNTGKPCSRGHLTARYTNTGACVGCVAHYKSGGIFSIKVGLISKKDIPALNAFVAALNIDRQLSEL